MADWIEDAPTLQTAVRAFTIVEAIKQLDGAGVTELSEKTSLAKSTIHRHLISLLQMEYVVKDGDTYHLGFKFLDLGEYARKRRRAIQMVEPYVSELAESTEERAQFILEEHKMGVFVYNKIGDRAVRTDTRIGQRVYLHATAAGKAIIANKPTSFFDELVVQKGLPELTSNTITEKTALEEELDSIRQNGISNNFEENISGVRAIGVPIIPDEHILGGLSISGPSHRMKGERFEETLPELLLGTANELELKIAYNDR